MLVEKSILVIALVISFLILPNFAMSKELKPGDPGYKDPAVAALISFLVIGGGQIYVGDITRGLIFMAVGYGSLLIFALAGLLGLLLGYLFLLGVWVYNIFDAYQLAKKYNAQGGKLKETASFNLNPALIY